MTRLSRTIMGAALVVGLASTTRAAEPDKLLPPDTDTVAIVNLKQIVGSDIIKKYALEQIKQGLQGDDAKKILDDLGLDPLKDIDRVVMGSVETVFKKGTDPKFLLIVHGKFNPQKIYKVAEDTARTNGDKFAMVKEGNTVLFRFTPREGEASIYGTVVNEKIVIAGTEKKLILDALKAADANKPAQVRKELAALIARLDDKASITVASLLKDKLNEVKLPGGGNLPIDLGGLQKAIPDIESLALAIKIGTDVTVDVSLGMKDANAAGDMRNALDDLFRDIKPLVQGLGQLDPRAKPLSDIINTFKVTSRNKDVTLTGKITGENIGQMMRKGD